jgi:hypothetical protein
MDIAKIIKLAEKKTLWINTNGMGMAVAEYLEAEGIEINRFELHRTPALQQMYRDKSDGS